MWPFISILVIFVCSYCNCTTGRDVEKIVEVLEVVEDWEGLAGRLNIDAHAIRTNCGTSIDQAHCYRRRLVRIYCDKLTSGDPRQVAVDIALVLDVQMTKKKQAQKLRKLFNSKLFCPSVA